VSDLSLRGYQNVPYPLNTPQWESFKNYAIAYYQEAAEIARSTAQNLSIERETIFRAVLMATVSPLVYLWEKWQLMTSEARLPYATDEYRKELEANIKKAKETTEKSYGGKK